MSQESLFNAIRLSLRGSKIHLLQFALCFIFALASGCASHETVFFVLSDAGKPDGGIRKFVLEKDVLRELAKPSDIPFLNYAAVSPKAGFFCASARLNGARAGGIIGFAADKGGNLAAKSVFGTDAGPCHIAFSPDSRYVYTANYSGGSIEEIDLSSDSGRTRIFRLHGSGPDKRRQRSPHPHCALFDPEGANLYAVDLGADSILIYPWSSAFGIFPEPRTRLKLPPGAGPRHAVFSADGNTLFVANELDSTVSAFIRENGIWTHAINLPTLPASEMKKQAKRNWPGAIKLSTDGNYVFVTNRGHDSVAVFRVNTPEIMRFAGAFKVGQEFPCDLVQTSDGRLIIANRKAGTVSVMDFGSFGGVRLTPSKVKPVRVPNASCLIPVRN